MAFLVSGRLFAWGEKFIIRNIDFILLVKCQEAQFTAVYIQTWSKYNISLTRYEIRIFRFFLTEGVAKYLATYYMFHSDFFIQFSLIILMIFNNVLCSHCTISDFVKYLQRQGCLVTVESNGVNLRDSALVFVSIFGTV